MDKHMNT